MTVLSVDINEIDGALAILPNTGDKACAVLSVCSAGLIATPAAFLSSKLLLASFPRGPGSHFAANVIETYGKAVLFCRATASVPGSFLGAVAPVAGSVGAIVKTGTGTSVFTNDGSTVVAAAAQVVVLFNVGGTRGTTGIVYQVSVNNGANFGPPQALGTAVTFAIGNGTGVVIAIGAGTVVAGDFLTFAVVAPILASAGTLVITNAGTSAVTIDGAATVDDDYGAYIEFLAGGTIGVAGITFRWSLDSGRTPSAPTALGTANTFTFPDGGGIKVNFGAGTILAGETVAFDTLAPQWNNTDLLAAISALKASAIPWEMLVVHGALSAAAVGVIDGAIDDKRHAWVGHMRMPVGAESDATYAASVTAVMSAVATTYGEICAADCEQVSLADGRTYRRPSLFPLAAREASVTAEVDIADPNLDALPGCQIRDAKGNVKYHDENETPSLSNARFSVLRTWKEFQGTRPNNPYLFSTSGSDFDIMPKRRVMNIAHSIILPFMARRLAKLILVDKKTGFIKKSERLEINTNATQLLLDGLKGMVSDANFVLSATDNLISKAPLTGEYRLVPGAYPEHAVLRAGFRNPALNIEGV